MLGRIGIATCILLLMSASAAAEDELEVRELTTGLYLISSDQGSYTTNTLALVGEDGVLLVDTQSETDAAALKTVVDGFGHGTPKFIINTHRHVEHIGGNRFFGADPVIIAHERVPEKLRSGSYIFEEFPPETYPDITVADSLTLYFNGERIRIIALPGSHDDNEIIVHFTRAGVVHLSSLVNGFNFPSIDRDGDVLAFEALVARAMEILPRDVTIVSGHNDTGSWADLGTYREMLRETAAVVRAGLADGMNVATMQEQNVLERWDRYAGSYVSTGDWIESLAEGLERGDEHKRSLYEPLYSVWKADGATAAVAHYLELKREHENEYQFDEITLIVIGDKLLKKEYLEDAAAFLRASVEEEPSSKYAYYASYELAKAYNRLGRAEEAAKYCRRSLEIKPDFEAARELLAEVGGE